VVEAKERLQTLIWMSIQKSGSEVRSFARWVPGMRYFLLGSATLVRGRPSRAARIYFNQNILV